jgi:hypothetical protein
MQPITPYGGAGPKNRDGIHTEWRNPDHGLRGALAVSARDLSDSLAMHQDERVDSSLGNQCRCDNGFAEGRRRRQKVQARRPGRASWPPERPISAP